MKYNVYILVKYCMYLSEFRIVTGPGLPYFFDFLKVVGQLPSLQCSFIYCFCYFPRMLPAPSDTSRAYFISRSSRLSRMISFSSVIGPFKTPLFIHLFLCDYASSFHTKYCTEYLCSWMLSSYKHRMFL